MIPDSMKRGKVAREGLPVGVKIAAGIVALLVLLFAGVALTMGTPPAQQDVTVDIPLE